ncbi:T9SS type A sorting domain-containing protein [Winogradskyella sp.]|uniref:T9SS type A sorting domain-containing protein n=1 Tax=Winogradskyella sp. TaxID=1883156 RepID=UPI0026261A78|nr:T9SS type A sorting domain-containing protein [Winogradskyella sp.]
MKRFLLLFFFLPLINFGQVQIGSDIDGEASNNLSGISVSISSDGLVVAVGAPLNGGNGANSGHVRIYENQGDNWVQIGSDIDGEALGDSLGQSVSLSSDGSVVAIGAPSNDANGVINSGHVRIYENQGGNWVQIGSDIDGEVSGDRLGQSVSLSSDGSVVAIGAPFNIGTQVGTGHIRIYENQGGNWVQIGSDITGDLSGDSFGESVSLSGDGSVVAVGASLNDANGINSGHARIYENQGGNWVQIGQDINGDGLEDRLGESVSLSSDGTIVAVGAPYNNSNAVDSGHVRIYENQGGNWVQIGFDIDGEASGDALGASVSLSSDGSVVAIGAPFNDGNGFNSGNVRIYENQGGNWVQIGSDINGETSGDISGNSISLSSDGTVLVIGAQLNAGNGLNSGHARVFDLSALLSVDDQTISNFSIYPNPTKDQFTIQLDNPSDLQNINIYNNLGQLVMTSKNTIVDVSKLTSGLYIVEVETAKGKGVKKLILE